MGSKNNNITNTESGNVLFLILVAVVLFAALSYAVTSSTRTTDDTGGSQTDRINAAALVQYPAGIRASIMRMVVDGAATNELEFNTPADFNDLTDERIAVFHPAGGNATYQIAAPDALAPGSTGAWSFNMEFEIDNIGSEIANDIGGNDVVAFLPGIREGICRHINREVGLTGPIPDTAADLSAAYNIIMNDAYIEPAGETVLGDLGANGTEALTGQPFGCFRNNGGEYVYYHVLIER